MEREITVIGQELTRKGAYSKFILFLGKEKDKQKDSYLEMCNRDMVSEAQNENHDHARKPVLKKSGKVPTVWKMRQDRRT